MAGQATTLVVNADDFGLSEGINRGILSAHQNGILSSTSLMPNGTAFDDAVALVKGLHPEPVEGSLPSGHGPLGVGVHISLVGEQCIAPIADLKGMVTDDGRLPESYAAFTRQLLSKRFNTGHVGTEMRAQLDKVLEAGIEPTHIDSHQHLHMLPALFPMVLDLANEYHIPVIRIPLERPAVPREPSAGNGHRHNPPLFSLRGFQMLILSKICQSRLQQVQAAGLKTADWFWGLGVSGKMDEANLLSTLSGLGPGVNEIMCHPGITDAATTERYKWDYSWDAECAALESDSARQFIEENNIRLASFAEAWE